MGPRFQKRGNLAHVSLGLGHRRGFNGAALSEARKPGSAVGSSARMSASMGPRFQKRGNSTSVPALYGTHFASMGPRFQKRGNTAACLCRDRESAASMGPRFQKRGNCAASASIDRGDRASMGPRFQKRGNQSAAKRFALSIVLLQWGRAFRSAETSR